MFASLNLMFWLLRQQASQNPALSSLHSSSFFPFPILSKAEQCTGRKLGDWVIETKSWQLELERWGGAAAVSCRWGAVGMQAWSAGSSNGTGLVSGEWWWCKHALQDWGIGGGSSVFRVGQCLKLGTGKVGGVRSCFRRRGGSVSWGAGRIGGEQG